MRLLVTAAVFSSFVISLSQQNGYWSSSSTKHAYKNVTIDTAGNCNKSLDMKLDVSAYNLYMDLAGVCSTVDETSFGFTCSYLFRQKDDFILLGNQLCVDVQGVPETFRRHTQLRVKVIDDTSKEEIKTVYSTSRLPSGQAAYYCIDISHNVIILSVSVRRSVNFLNRVCPLVKKDDVLKLGTVLMKPILPISMLETNKCYHVQQPEPNFLLKVDVKGRGPCQIDIHNTLLSSKIFGCLTLMYVSKDYSCDASVSLKQERDESNVKISLSRRFDRPSQWTLPTCRTFEVEQDDYPYLEVWKGQGRCSGTFAVNISITNTFFQDDDDMNNQSKKMRHVYMAVFVSLTAICLIILGVTCICCLRNRAKALRNTRRRHMSTPSALNAGFQAPIVDPASASLSWSQSNPGHVAGLPTYEEIVQGGSNPSSDSDKEDKPPSYDSLYATET